MLALALGLWIAEQIAPPPPGQREDCEALYRGEGQPKDDARALACYRAQENWMMVVIMQLNGEGTPVDVAGARATFKHLVEPDGHVTNFDAEQLDDILKKREADPQVKAPPIDFCKNVAIMTPSRTACARRRADRRKIESATELPRLRAGIDARAWPAFDAVAAAFEVFVEAEGYRVYQRNIDGTVRIEAAAAAEAFARGNFMNRLAALAKPGAAGPEPGGKSFAAADRALNAANHRDVGESTAADEDMARDSDADTAKRYRAYARDYKAKSRAAQRAWVRYRDGMGKLAVAVRPGNRSVESLIRALITEDRIIELTPAVGEFR